VQQLISLLTVTCNTETTHTDCIVVFLQQNGYVKMPQCYVVRMLPIW